jgi:F-type H+-transporting ATPase subunit b
LGIQTVNAIVVVWLLQRFFWRPVAAIIAQRRLASLQSIADAKAKTDKADAALKDIATTRAGFTAEHDAILAAAHKQAASMQNAAQAQATSDAAKLAATAKAGIVAESQKAAQGWQDQSALLAVDIAGRLAGRLQGTAVQSAFLDWLATAIAALPAGVRQTVAAGGAPLQAVTATPLDAGAETQARDAIFKAFGGQPPITFSTDPAVINGIELHGQHFVINNSWRADLARIRAGLHNDA